VTGTIDPFSSNTQVIPSFFPISAGVMVLSVVCCQWSVATDNGPRTTDRKYFPPDTWPFGFGFLAEPHGPSTNKNAP
jgi:hypothetical protein